VVLDVAYCKPAVTLAVGMATTSTHSTCP